MKWFQAIILLLLWQAGLCQQAGPLLVIRQNQLSGLIDSAGNVVLATAYFEIEPVADFGLFIVHNGAGEAIYSASQRTLISEFYDKVEIVTPTRFIVTRDNLCGLAGEQGNLIIPMIYRKIFRASTGKYVCNDGAKITIFKRDGTSDATILSAEVHEFNGYFVFKSENNNYGLAGKTGETISSARFSEFSESYGVIELKNADSLYVFHTESGKLLRFSSNVRIRFAVDGMLGADALPFYYKKTANGKNWFSVYSDQPLKEDLTDAFIYESRVLGCYIVNTGYMWLLDSLGNSLLSDRYENLWFFRDRQFVVQNAGLRGLYDLDSGLVLSVVYRNLTPLYDSIVQKSWIWAVNSQGGQLLNNGFEVISNGYFDVFQIVQGRGIIAIQPTGNWMVFDTDGREICKPIYSSIQALPSGLWKVIRDNGCGLMTNAGREITEMKYDDISVRNNSVKCTIGNEAEFYRWDGTTLEPVVNYSNYRRLEITGTQLLSLSPGVTGQGRLVWRRDSVQRKFGLLNVRTKQYAIPPMYDYVKYDQQRDISFTGIIGDTSFFNLGPLKFIGRMRLGVVNHASGRIIAPNEYMFLNFNYFFVHFIDGDSNRITPFYNSDRNVSIGIDTMGNWRTLSYTGLTYFPDIQYVAELRSSAKAWRFDSCYVAERSKCKTDKKICSVASAFAQIKVFLRPANAFTDSAVKNLRLNLYAANADSLQFQRGAGERKDPGLWSIVNRSQTPMFLNKYSYTELIERRGDAYCNMMTFMRRKRFTFIDSTGYAISDPVFIKAYPFSEGLALVKKGSRYGYINRKGEMVIEEKFRKALPFSEGKAAAAIKGGKFGYIGTDGEWVIEPAFREALSFSEGMAPVKPANLFGYIDETGKMIIDPAWLRANPFYNGTAVVYSKKGFGLIDESGKTLLKCRYSRITPPDSNKVRIVAKGASLFLVDEKGEVISKKSKSIVDAGNGYYCLKKGLKYILIRADGTFTGSFDSDRPLLVGNDRVLVTRRNRFYYYDLTGNKLLGPYVKAAEFRMGLAVVSDQTETYIIDVNGDKRFSLFSNRLSGVGSFDENGLAVIRRGAIYKLVDTAGTVHFESMERPKYAGNQNYILTDDGSYLFNISTGISYSFSKWNEISMPSEGLYTVTSAGLYGISDIFGRYQTDPQFTHIERVQQGIYRVNYGDKTGYLRFDGTVIWEPSR